MLSENKTLCFFPVIVIFSFCVFLITGNEFLKTKRVFIKDILKNNNLSQFLNIRYGFGYIQIS
jgi:hypothetical protein